MFGWYPIVWEELVYWRRKVWLYLATYILSPLIFFLSFGFGVGRRLKMIMPGGTGYLEFLVPGIIALAVFNNGVTSVTIRMFYSRLYFKSFESYQLAPVSNICVWLGYAAAGAMRGLLAGLIVLGAISLLVPQIRLYPLCFPVLLLISFCFGSFGVLIGLWLRCFDDHTLASEFILMPMTFFSGTLVPVERLPVFLKQVVWAFPLTPAVKLLRAVMAGNPAHWGLAALVVGWTFIFFLLARFKLNKLDN